MNSIAMPLPVTTSPICLWYPPVNPWLLMDSVLLIIRTLGWTDDMNVKFRWVCTLSEHACTGRLTHPLSLENLMTLGTSLPDLLPDRFYSR